MVLRRSPAVLAQRVSDESVLLDPRSGRYFGLNDVGGRVWELCDGATPVEVIVARICSEYAAEPEVVRTDVTALIAELLAESLLDKGV